jgi:O-succinylbenzoic acid--CoA ligase
VPSDPDVPPGLATLRGFVRGKLPDFAAPRSLIVVPAVPLLPSGKPDLQALRLMARQG